MVLSVATRIQWEKIGPELQRLLDRARQAESRLYKASSADDPNEARLLTWDLRYIQLAATNLADRLEKGLV